MRRRLSGVGLLTVLVTGALLASGCGYSLAGRGSFLPDYIKVIGVPQFDNSTTTFGLYKTVTEAVRQELHGRGRYRVMPDATGDAVITGVVTGMSIAPVATNASQLATRYAVTLTARVQFRDTHDNKVLWENPSVQFRDEFPVSTGTTVTDTNQFFRQDAARQQELARQGQGGLGAGGERAFHLLQHLRLQRHRQVPQRPRLKSTAL